MKLLSLFFGSCCDRLKQKSDAFDSSRMQRRGSEFEISLVIFLVNPLDRIFHSIYLKTFHTKKERTGLVNWEGTPRFWKSAFCGMAFWPNVSVHQLIVFNSSDCSIAEVIWTYHTIRIQNTPDCYFLLCRSCSWNLVGFSELQIRLFWGFENPKTWRTYWSEKTLRRRKLKLNDTLSTHNWEKPPLSAEACGCSWIIILLILYGRMWPSFLRGFWMVEWGIAKSANALLKDPGWCYQ